MDDICPPVDVYIRNMEQFPGIRKSSAEYFKEPLPGLNDGRSRQDDLARRAH